MYLYLKYTPVAVFGLLLSACGGGGGGGGGGPIASTDTFPLGLALKNRTDNGYTNTFSVTGTAPDPTSPGTICHVVGNGTISVDAASANPNNPTTFEGQAALLNNETVNGNLTLCNHQGTTNSSSKVYTTTPGYVPLGVNVTGGAYCVAHVLPPSGLPATVKVGDQIMVGTFDCYASSAKAQPTGSTDLSFAVEADTEHTAILNFIQKEYDTSHTLTLTDQSRYRIDTFGTVAWISETATGPGYSYTFK